MDVEDAEHAELWPVCWQQRCLSHRAGAGSSTGKWPLPTAGQKHPHVKGSCTAGLEAAPHGQVNQALGSAGTVLRRGKGAMAQKEVVQSWHHLGVLVLLWCQRLPALSMYCLASHLPAPDSAALFWSQGVASWGPPTATQEKGKELVRQQLCGGSSVLFAGLV